jgi:MMP 1-O-methyltransferase
MTRDLEKLVEITSQVDGWLTDREGELLYNLATRCSGKGVIVEIGSWKGKSAIWLASGSRDSSKVKVHCVDPHTGSPEHGPDVQTLAEFNSNIAKAGLQDLVVPLVMTSEEAVRNWDKKVELLFVDGNHEYEEVEKDMVSWFPYLTEGAIVALHDTTSCTRLDILLSETAFAFIGWPGPKRVVSKYIFASHNVKAANFLDTITWAEKCTDNSLKDRFLLRLTQVRKLVPDSLPRAIKLLTLLPKSVKSGIKGLVGWLTQRGRK